DLPDYVKDYPKQKEERTKKPVNRAITIVGPIWSPKGTWAALDIRSQDNKDRWLMLWDTASNKMRLLDRQRDEAWVGGPGTQTFFNSSSGWVDDNTYWYRSEATGYS